MGNGSLLCGNVIKVLGRDYLVRLSNGKTSLGFTDNETYGNGMPRKGELVLGWIKENGHASILTRVVQVPMKI